jgi:NADPH:quinone reductase-like Zn-dependent oxidoreductase
MNATRTALTAAVLCLAAAALSLGACSRDAGPRRHDGLPPDEATALLDKRVWLGLHWGAYRQHEPERIPQAMQALFELYSKGGVRPVVSSTYPLKDAAVALDEIASRRSVGKVLLLPKEERDER